MNSKRLSYVATTLAVVVLLATPDWLHATPDATSGAQHEASSHESGHGTGHEPSLRELALPAINFTIYLFIILRYVVPAMREYLRRRRSDVVLAESQANEALTHAERALAANKTRLASLATEAESLRRDLVEAATHHAERLIAQAKETGSRRLTDAALVAEQERRRARAALRAHIATVATNLAESRIRTVLTPDDQRGFVQQFLKDARGR